VNARIVVGLATIAACSTPEIHYCGPGESCARTDSGGSASHVLRGPDGGAFYVDDDVVVTVNAIEVHSDRGTGGGDIGPITFEAVPGDVVTVSFFDTAGVSKGHEDLWLAGPGVAAHQVHARLVGVGSSYPADAIQPFDIAVFRVPAPGGVAEHECLPEVALNQAAWQTSPNLVVHTATTRDYHATWTVNQHDYRFTPDCDGWISDVFIAPGGAYATVRWNMITNQLETYPVSGQVYDGTAGATYAVQTLFPPGDLGLLAIH
jgi:hypothetical protein